MNHPKVTQQALAILRCTHLPFHTGASVHTGPLNGMMCKYCFARHGCPLCNTTLFIETKFSRTDVNYYFVKISYLYPISNFGQSDLHIH